ncbi:hypothetical protein ACOMHN_041130 [Nucella lapillus]
MAMYSKRDSGYKVGMLIFCVGVIAFVTGFATPHWVKFKFRLTPAKSSSALVQQPEWDVDGYTGLWSYCFNLPATQTGSESYLRCDDVSSSSPGWMTAVKVVDCTAVGVMGLALCFFFFTNCVARKVAFTRILEIGTGISGVVGIAGAAVYLWQSFSDDDVTNALQQTGQLKDLDKTLSWSFYLNAGGCVIILLATILIALYNSPIKPKRTTTNTSRANRVARPSAPYPSLDRRQAATCEQGYGPSGSNPYVISASVPTGTNPYVISAAMTSQAPKLYPSLQDVHEESD